MSYNVSWPPLASEAKGSHECIYYRKDIRPLLDIYSFLCIRDSRLLHRVVYFLTLELVLTMIPIMKIRSISIYLLYNFNNKDIKIISKKLASLSLINIFKFKITF